jgi:hypothetical protein
MTDYRENKLFKKCNLVLSLIFYVFALWYAFVYSSFSGVFGGGLMGVEADVLDYLPLTLTVLSFVWIVTRFKHYRSLVFWSSGTAVLLCVKLLVDL